MTGFLSIIWRELTVGARQRATHRSRLISAAVMIGIFMVFLLFQKHPNQYLGPMLFGLILFILYIQALLSGIRLTADCLTEEKREGTLGLLYLSGLRGVEIVLGKMAVRSLRGFYAMLATLPVFGFCVLLGGVQGSDAFRAAIGLVATMFFSLAIGVFVSSRAADEKAAFAGAVGLLAAFCVLPGALWWMIHQIDPGATWANYIRWLSPFDVETSDYWKPLLFRTFIAIGFLAASAVCLNNSFRKQFAFVAPLEKSRRSGERKRRSEKLRDSNPFLWLLGLDTFSARVVKVHFVAVLLVSLFIASQSTGPGPAMGGVVILYGLHLAWKLFVAADALRRLHNDHRSGALELLLTTPADPNEILKAQSNSTSRVFFLGAIGLCIANVSWFMNSHGWDDIFVLPIGGAIFLFVDAAALRWTAMLQAFKPARFPAGVMIVVSKVIVPPIALLWLLLISGRGFSTQEINTFLVFWFIGCGIYDAILIGRAKKQLNGIRLLASSEPAPVQTKGRQLPKPIQWLLLTDSTETPSRVM